MNSKSAAGSKIDDNQSKYRNVTNAILDQLRQLSGPWRATWDDYLGEQRNLFSDEPYDEFNAAMLASRRFASPYWLTRAEIKSLNGRIKKNETGMVALYAERGSSVDPFFIRKNSKRLVIGRTVFNAVQVQGISTPQAERSRGPLRTSRNEMAEALVAQMRTQTRIREGRYNECRYSAEEDIIDVPAFDRFDDAESYYRELMVGLMHATGHPNRLNRLAVADVAAAGRALRIREDVLAQLAASFICEPSGITRDNHRSAAAYIRYVLGDMPFDEVRTYLLDMEEEAVKTVVYLGEQCGMVPSD